MAQDKMLQEAIIAIANGQRKRGRDLLTRLLRANQTNPDYWLWMSSVVDSHKERVYCLQSVMRLDPQNPIARQGLVLHGALTPAPGKAPTPFTNRTWTLAEEDLAKSGRTRRITSVVALVGVGVIILGLILTGIIAPSYLPGGLFSASALTVTPVFEALSETATSLPTNTPPSSPKQNLKGPLPLWMLLEATYTPTPLYVDTPHPVNEAYRAGLRAFKEDDVNGMLSYMQQAVDQEPNLADAHYYVGEAYRLLGMPEKALGAYQQALEVNPSFAPAYLGRARLQPLLDPDVDPLEDLNLAIELDPMLAEAYLDRASYWIEQDEVESALQDLDQALELAPDSAQAYLSLAELHWVAGENELALKAAYQAYHLDKTMLPVYLMLGELFLEAGNPRVAHHFLEIYLQYDQQDPQAWAYQGQAQYLLDEDLSAAMQSFDKALAIREDLFSALYYRGMIYLERGEGQMAVNDLFAARAIDRDSLAASLGLARALLMAERTNDAKSQFLFTLGMAEDDRQRAEVYYYRALALESIGEFKEAGRDWLALLALPADVVPQEWLDTAQEHLILLTPTATATPTPKVGTATPTSTPPSPTPTRTPSPTARRTPLPPASSLEP